MKKFFSLVLFVFLAAALSVNAFAAEIYGDINGDGKVNVIDANLIRRYAAKMIELEEEQLSVADVNGDGKVNVLDTSSVIQNTADVIDFFPVEIVAEGYCGAEDGGENIKWTFDIYDKLSFNGAGAMEDYSSAAMTPWYGYSANSKGIYIEKWITHIGSYAFAELAVDYEIEIPEKAESIGEGAFFSSFIDGKLELPEGIKSIGAYAFAATKIEGELVFPEGLESIGSYAFERCAKITSVKIPSTVKEIGDFAFSYWGEKGTNKLEKIEVSPDNADYCSVDGILFTKDMKTLIASPQLKTGRYFVPEEVTEIAGRAFENTGFYEIRIAENVKIIGDDAFNNANTSVRIKSDLESFGRQENADEIYFYGKAPEKTEKVAGYPGTLIFYPAGFDWEIETNGKWNGYATIEWEPEYTSLMISEKKDGKVKFELSENKGLSAISFEARYDPEKITITGCNLFVPGATFNDGIPGVIYFVWDAISAQNITELYEIEFTSSDENAGFTVEENEDFIFADANYDLVKVEIINESIVW
ncbi:MAG: leucine-rich repeat protein [Oscillospiraceae bacterium]|nr:leucine-rich repeat protein [Oscillospiraceae bacterium]